MPTIAELRANEWSRILNYGQFKTGKTAGAATWPRCRILSLDPDGHQTLINPEMEKLFGYSKNVVDVFIPKRTARNNRGIPTEYIAYDDTCRYFDESMTKPDSFDTWILDSGTTLGDLARTKGVILLGGTLLGPKPMSFTQANAIKTGMLLPRLQDFGAERSLLEQFIDMLLDTSKHVIVLAHEKEIWEGEGEDIKRVGIGPMFTGQSAEKIPLKFSEVYNLRVQKEGDGFKRYLQTQPDGIRACGSRIGVPNGTLWNYTDWTAARRKLQTQTQTTTKTA